jgi:hypothetical protein
LNVLQTPIKWVRGLFNKALMRPQARPMPERPVLEGALGGWVDLLRKEAARKSGHHALWQHIHDGFSTGLGNQIRDRFEQSLGSFHQSMNNEVERTARKIHEDLLQNPVALNTLRSAKFTLEVGAIVGSVATVVTMGAALWLNLVLIPLATSMTNYLVELLGRSYVDSLRDQARLRQETLVTQQLSGPLADWLIQWPATGGSSYERLHLVLQRLPNNVRDLEATVRAALQ